MTMSAAAIRIGGAFSGRGSGFGVVLDPPIFHLPGIVTSALFFILAGGGPNGDLREDQPFLGIPVQINSHDIRTGPRRILVKKLHVHDQAIVPMTCITITNRSWADIKSVGEKDMLLPVIGRKSPESLQLHRRGRRENSVIIDKQRIITDGEMKSLPRHC